MLGELRPLGSGSAISLNTERILIGNHRLCDVVIHSVHVAPVHCQLLLRGSWWYIRNLAGALETKINAHPVTEEKALPGDILWIGDRHYEVCYDPYYTDGDARCSPQPTVCKTAGPVYRIRGS